MSRIKKDIKTDPMGFLSVKFYLLENVNPSWLIKSNWHVNIYKGSEQTG